MSAVLKHLTAVHVCVPNDDPVVLRALISRPHYELSGKGYSFFMIGLDSRFPLSTALKGMLAVPMETLASVAMPTGRYTGPALDDRPLHFEIALM